MQRMGCLLILRIAIWEGLEMTNITGSCLCGAVNYQICQDIGDITHCYCIKCRKAHGAAFVQVVVVKYMRNEIIPILLYCA